jgi:dihydroxyacetone kinase-like protein
MMRSLVSNTHRRVEEILESFFKTHPDLVVATDNPRVLKYKNAPITGKVGIVVSEGAGHKPVFLEYVGKNMADAVAAGESFAAPAAIAFYDAFKAVDAAKGVACFYSNGGGVRMNVKMAVELAKDDGIEVKTVVAADAFTPVGGDERLNCCGTAGQILMLKVGGAKAACGGTLDEVIASVQKAVNNMHSVEISLAPCINHPKFPTFRDARERYGGFRAEPERPMGSQPAEEVAGIMTDRILGDCPFMSGDELVVLFSRVGVTPAMEHYILFNQVADILETKGLKIYRTYVENYSTSLETAGIILTLMKLDAELKELVDLETYSVGFKQFRC